MIGSIYEGAIFYGTSFQNYSDKENVHLKVETNKIKINDIYIPELTIKKVNSLNEINVLSMGLELGMTENQVAAALMGFGDTTVFDSIRIQCPVHDDVTDAERDKLFKFILGQWDKADDSPRVLLISDPYLSTDGNTYIDTFEGRMAGEELENTYLEGEIVRQCLTNHQDWDIPGEINSASIKNKPFYEEKLDFGKNGSVNDITNYYSDFVRFDKEGTFDI
jgi:hypothetical protein